MRGSSLVDGLAPPTGSGPLVAYFDPTEEEALPRWSRPGGLHGLPHLVAELLEPLPGLCDAGELLRREHGAYIEGGLGAALGELVAELADQLELGLDVRGLDLAGGDGRCF